MGKNLREKEMMRTCFVAEGSRERMILAVV